MKAYIVSKTIDGKSLYYAGWIIGGQGVRWDRDIQSAQRFDNAKDARDVARQWRAEYDRVELS